MLSDKKIPLVSIVGPTASGKTALSIELAKKFDGEIVCADSMQIYKGMDIATAKPTIEEQQGIRHHLLGFLDVDKTFSVAQYCDMAHKIIADVHKRNKLPILVGGTGLYVDSLIENITFSEVEEDDSIRRELYNEYENNGIDYLFDMLKEFDEESFERLVKEKNVKRIIRAIEIYKTTGITMSQHILNSKINESPYRTVKIGLNSTDRQFLYDRINKRVDMMVNDGLLEEAQAFLDVNLSSTSSMAIGHKELLPYLKNEDTLENCLENLKMQTRRYAKRQLTWFNRDKEINWFFIDTLNKNELIDNAIDIVKKGIFDEEQ